MKELSAEEKADRYDRAKSIMEKYLKSGNAGVIAENTIKKAFPELKEKESGDERIMEDIITYLSTVDDKELIPYETWISWIKKQGEQKPAEWSEDDEAILSWCISDIERAKYCKSQTKPELCDKEINWLKSLKERYTQFPSNEQIEVCKKVYADILSARGFDLDTVNGELNRLEEQFKQF